MRSSPRPDFYETRGGRVLSTRVKGDGKPAKTGGAFLGPLDLTSEPFPAVKRHALNTSLRGRWRYNDSEIGKYRDNLDEEKYKLLQAVTKRRLAEEGSQAGPHKLAWHRMERTVVEEWMARARL